MESRIYPPLCLFEISQKAPINPNDEKTNHLKFIHIHSLSDTSLLVASGKFAPN